MFSVLFLACFINGPMTGSCAPVTSIKEFKTIEECNSNIEKVISNLNSKNKKTGLAAMTTEFNPVCLSDEQIVKFKSAYIRIRKEKEEQNKPTESHTLKPLTDEQKKSGFENM